MGRMDVLEVRERRRRNYQLLRERCTRIPGLRPLFQSLPEGVCPLCLPMVTAQPREIARRLQTRSVPAIAWWAGYHPAFPQGPEYSAARDLKDHVLALPIHQQLEPYQVEAISSHVAECLEEMHD
jgi:dTDP-4-amino-4,6-dideoxygalactose transaminase